jgi:TonB-dependent SusC/RagA subfamily outer membrane receptor
VRGESLASALAGLIPEDIRRVDVLKDLASTSIYGMSGAGGVIIITTRR